MSAETQTPAEPKVIREETFDLTDWDKQILTGFSTAISLAQQALEQAQRNVTNYLGVKSMTQWGFPEGVDVRFRDVSLEKGRVTVQQLEVKDVPKDEAATPQSDGSSAASGEEAKDTTESK